MCTPKKTEWEEIQNRLYKVAVKSLHVGQMQEIGAASINQLKNMVISYMCSIAVINNDMTIGTMMSLQYIIGPLNLPLQQFVHFSRSLQDAVTSIERMAEIYSLEA